MKDAFECLLRPELLLQISGSGQLKVKENDKSAVLKELLIKRIPDGAVAFELDHQPKGELKKKLNKAFSQLSCYIHGEHKKANKSCDFVIVSPTDQTVKVILGDLKSRSPKKPDCAAQLRNSEIFVDYLLNLIAEYHEVQKETEFKKVVFFVVDPFNAKAPTQQKNRSEPHEESGVTYFPVTVAGRNNGRSIVSFTNFA